jgi:YbbR domain-containing protein
MSNKEKREEKRGLGKAILLALTANAPMKLLSLLFAIIIWSVVIAQTDPLRQRIVYDVPIERVGIESLKSRGLALSAEESPDVLRRVDVKAEVATSDLQRVNNTNVKVRVDLSGITAPGSFELPLQASVTGISGSAVPVGSSKVTVEIESLVETTVPIMLETSGSLGQNYRRGEGTIFPAAITVAGPATVIASLSQALVSLDLTDLSASISKSLPIFLVDQYGDPIDAISLTMSQGDARLELPIYPVKEVPIEYLGALVGSPAEGYEMKSIEILPKSVRIAAEADALENIHSILTFGFDIGGMSQSGSARVQLRKPSDLIWMEYEEAELRFTLHEETASKTFSLIPVEVINAPGDYAVSTHDAVVDVLLVMPRTRLGEIRREDIRVVLDLAAALPGSQRYEAEVRIECEDKELLKRIEASVLPQGVVATLSRLE